ncbi:phytanoyl-CoA dioxygenase family protein [Actinopolymorpha sp. NPDC004070]|uniref:phytanoyl-CoA dioxygenase family protein n=1 Tax=Actinopolymorpha sp. NPDC004070 TaxID=3154548 RepID=UPI0033A01D6E
MTTTPQNATDEKASDGGTADRPRLTPAQRLHLDVYGFVLLENVLTQDEIARIKDALYRLKAEPDLAARGVYVNSRSANFLSIGHLVEYDQALLDYATHPALIPLVEDLVGGRVRLEESEAIINSRDPDAPAEPAPTPGRKNRVEPLGFHTGTRHGWGTYHADHHFHCLFAKTLAYLTDVGPDDGGTAVIPGSHRLGWPEQDIIAAAREDDRLIHQVEATAGSVLLFAESLVHSSTAVRSDRERAVMICGYTPPMMQVWPGNEPSPEFVASLPERQRSLLGGGDSWPWSR